MTHFLSALCSFSTESCARTSDKVQNEGRRRLSGCGLCHLCRDEELLGQSLCFGLRAELNQAKTGEKNTFLCRSVSLLVKTVGINK